MNPRDGCFALSSDYRPREGDSVSAPSHAPTPCRCRAGAINDPGLLFATVLTLVVVPVFYSIFFRVNFRDFSFGE